VLAFRVATGGFFVAAGVAKLARPAEAFAGQIRAHGILPAGWEWPLAHALPWLELIAGGFLLLGMFAGWAAALVALQLVAFALFLAASLAWGRAPEDCGCLPGLSETPGQALLRDAVMLAWAALAARGLPGRLALDGWLAGAQEDARDE